MTQCMKDKTACASSLGHHPKSPEMSLQKQLEAALNGRYDSRTQKHDASAFTFWFLPMLKIHWKILWKKFWTKRTADLCTVCTFCIEWPTTSTAVPWHSRHHSATKDPIQRQSLAGLLGVGSTSHNPGFLLHYFSSSCYPAAVEFSYAHPVQLVVKLQLKLLQPKWPLRLLLSTTHVFSFPV